MDPDQADIAPPGLVPELLVAELAKSLHFWVTLCGFEVLYDRPREGFAYLQSGTAHIMLEQLGAGRNWVSGSLERPLGRGVNFQIAVPTIEPLIERLSSADWPLFMAREEKWYQAADALVGVCQFLVQDPDGYLVRLSSSLTSPDPAGG